MIKSERVYSPQNYLMAVTGRYYIIRGANDIETIEDILNDHGLEFWNYPLIETEYVIENNLNVVLVDCMIVNEDTDEFEHVYRWFEVPEDFKEE